MYDPVSDLIQESLLHGGNEQVTPKELLEALPDIDEQLFSCISAQRSNITKDEDMITVERACLYASVESEFLRLLLDNMSGKVLFYYISGEDMEASNHCMPTGRKSLRHPVEQPAYTNMLSDTTPASVRKTKIGHVLASRDPGLCHFTVESEEGGRDAAIPLEWVELENGLSMVPLEETSLFKIYGQDARFFHKHHEVPPGYFLVLFLSKDLTDWPEFLSDIGLLRVMEENHEAEEDFHSPRGRWEEKEASVRMTLGKPANMIDFEDWLEKVQPDFFGKKPLPDKKKGRSRGSVTIPRESSNPDVGSWVPQKKKRAK
jgi:hypothetical protein